MSLRLQLLLVSLLMLVLPWAAYRYVQEMESALRQGQEQALLATGRAVALTLAGNETFFPALDIKDPLPPLYAGLLPHPITLDGYADDWTDYPHDYRNAEFGNGVDAGTTLRYRLGQRDETLYLLLEVEDREKVHYRPVEPRANGDRFVIRLANSEGGFTHLLVASSAAGHFNGHQLDGYRLDRVGPIEYRLSGYWLETAEGYRLEMSLPLELADRGVDLFFIDVDPGDTGPLRWQGTAPWRARGAATRLVHPSPRLGEALLRYTPPGHRLRVTDLQGWLLAEQDRRAEAAERYVAQQSENLWEAALVQLVRWILGEQGRRSPITHRSGQLTGAMMSAVLSGREASDWYRPQRTDLPVILAAAPIVREGEVLGAVIVEQSSDLVAALTGLAFTRLFYFTLLALFVAALGLLGFASILSWRVRRLRNAAENAVAPDGTIRGDFPRSRMPDEIGDLSRSYADLLGELRDYTGYLRRLASILSHELRTPLAVVKSSLENLQQIGEGESAEAYIERAREGTERLGRLLSAMSEAGRVEQALATGEEERVDLVQLTRSCVAGYRDAYPSHRFELIADPALPSSIRRGQPDLLVQMLDKLVDNAVGFSAPGSTIRFLLEQRDGGTTLAVRNPGPPLPEHLRNRLFDPMVTMREKRDNEPHLGLGLYVARLIAERHGATLSAANLPDGSGVEFSVTFPGLVPK